MSVLVFASFGLMLMKRLATWPPSKNPVHRVSTEDGSDLLLGG